MQVKTRIKAGGMPFNHNETLVRVQKPTQGLKGKTHVKAGALLTGGSSINGRIFFRG
jgi:hypothetical protein